MQRRHASRLGYASLIVSILLPLGQALACIGNGTTYAIGFRESGKPGELIAAVTRKDKSGTVVDQTEILDDTGYIGLHLAITNIVKRGDATSGKTVEAADPSVSLAKARLYDLQNYLRKNLDAATALKLIAESARLEEALAKSPVEIASLPGGIQAINSAFYQEKIEINAATRKTASDPFGPEVGFSTLGLPTYLRFRSVSSCNAGIDSFNAVPTQSTSGGKSKGSAAPSVK